MLVNPILMYVHRSTDKKTVRLYDYILTTLCSKKKHVTRFSMIT